MTPFRKATLSGPVSNFNDVGMQIGWSVRVCGVYIFPARVCLCANFDGHSAIESERRVYFIFTKTLENNSGMIC